MAKHFAPEVIDALQTVVRTLKDNQGWAQTSWILGGVSRYKLDRFIDPTREEGGTSIPGLPDLRLMVTSLASYVEGQSSRSLVALCGKELDILLEDTPRLDQFRSLKRLTDLDEGQQEELSGAMNGAFLSFRRHRTKGILVSHVKIADTYARTGLATCKIQQNVQGQVYTIDGTVFRRDKEVYLLGYDRQYGHLRTLNLMTIGSGFDLFSGLVSGFEPFGPAFTSRVVLGRLPLAQDYEDVLEDTGHFEDFGRAEDMAERLLGRPGVLARHLLDDPSSYISVSFE